MQFALQNGYKLVKTFKDEGISAKNMDRPALQELLAYCIDETNEVEAVIVWKLDRISRNVADYTATPSPFFAQNNIQLLTVTDINGEGLDVEMMQKKSIRKRIDKIDKTIKSVFENGFNKHDEGMMKNIEDWEVERKTLVLEEQEMCKITVGLRILNRAFDC